MLICWFLIFLDGGRDRKGEKIFWVTNVWGMKREFLLFWFVIHNTVLGLSFLYVTIIHHYYYYYYYFQALKVTAANFL